MSLHRHSNPIPDLSFDFLYDSRGKVRRRRRYRRPLIQKGGGLSRVFRLHPHLAAVLRKYHGHSCQWRVRVNRVPIRTVYVHITVALNKTRNRERNGGAPYGLFVVDSQYYSSISSSLPSPPIDGRRSRHGSWLPPANTVHANVSVSTGVQIALSRTIVLTAYRWIPSRSPFAPRLKPDAQVSVATSSTER